MPQGLPGFHEPPDGYVYGKTGDLYRSSSPAGGTLWMKLSNDTLNIGWHMVSGAYIYPTPTPTPTPTHTVTPTMTPTYTPTPTLTPTATVTPTLTPTISPSMGVSPTPTPTQTMTVTPSNAVVYGGIYRQWYNSSDCSQEAFHTEISPNCAFSFEKPGSGAPTDTMSPNVPGYPDHVPTTDPIWSCRMSASLYAEATDNYYLTVESDDSVSIRIDGSWVYSTTDGSGTATCSLSAGWHTFETRYANFACCLSMLSIQWKRANGSGGYHEMNEFSYPYGPMSSFSVNRPAEPNGIVSSYGSGIYGMNTIVPVGLTMESGWAFVSWSGVEHIELLDSGSGTVLNTCPNRVRFHEDNYNYCSITAATKYVGVVTATPTPTPTVTPTPVSASCHSANFYAASGTGTYDFEWFHCHDNVHLEHISGSTNPGLIVAGMVCVIDGSIVVHEGTTEDIGPCG